MPKGEPLTLLVPSLEDTYTQSKSSNFYLMSLSDFPVYDWLKKKIINR